MATQTNTNPVVTERPEVRACRRRVDELRAEIEQVEAAATFWASLVDHHHGEEAPCDKPDCYEAWAAYPNG